MEDFAARGGKIEYRQISRHMAAAAVSQPVPVG